MNNMTPQPSAASTVRMNNFGLDERSMQRLLDAGMKPQEIAGTPDVQHERVHELVRWFVRLIGGGANPKWTTMHAYELAYYIASNGINRAIDMVASKQAAFLEGANISADDRAMLERIGAINPQTAPRKDAVTREDIQKWARLAGIEYLLTSENNYAVLGDFALFARQAVAQPSAAPCDRPPAGWTCSRVKDHYGPCAATQEEVTA